MTILLGIVGVCIFLLVPFGLYTAVSSRRARNNDMRELIGTIQSSRAQVTERKSKHDAVLARYAKPAPPLAGFIEEAARSQGITVPESSDKPEIPHGKRFTERLNVVKMHKIGMLALVRMLEKIEQSGYPVAITRLNLKPRTGEPDSYEVELGVSAFDRKPDPKPEGEGTGATSTGGEEAEEP